MLNEIMVINTAEAISVLFTSGYERVGGISDVGRITAVLRTRKLVYYVIFVTITFNVPGRKYIGGRL